MPKRKNPLQLRLISDISDHSRVAVNGVPTCSLLGSCVLRNRIEIAWISSRKSVALVFDSAELYLAGAGTMVCGKHGTHGERSSGAAHVLTIRVRTSNTNGKILAPLPLFTPTTSAL
jgi:hypothetical protein